MGVVNGDGYSCSQTLIDVRERAVGVDLMGHVSLNPGPASVTLCQLVDTQRSLRLSGGIPPQPGYSGAEVDTRARLQSGSKEQTEHYFGVIITGNVSEKEAWDGRQSGVTVDVI